MDHPDILAALDIARVGSMRGKTPGRSDVLNINVPGESYVVPSDVVSAIGHGNTEAGFAALEKMFPPHSREHRSDGGPTGKVPVVVANGEFVIHPEHVKRVGGGDIKKGHAALRDFVTIVRNKHIKTLKKLKGPHR